VLVAESVHSFKRSSDPRSGVITSDGVIMGKWEERPTHWPSLGIPPAVEADVSPGGWSSLRGVARLSGGGPAVGRIRRRGCYSYMLNAFTLLILQMDPGERPKPAGKLSVAPSSSIQLLNL
jgi:hypothetical protein